MFLLLLQVFLASCGSATTTSQDLAAARAGRQLLAKVKHALDTATTLHGKFNMTVSRQGSKQVASAELQSQQNSKERVVVFQSSMRPFSAGAVTVEDGEHLWQYYPDQKLVYRSPATPEGINGNVTPLYMIKFVFTSHNASLVSSRATVDGHSAYDVHVAYQPGDPGLPYTGEVYIDKKTMLPMRISLDIQHSGQIVYDIPLLVLNQPIPANTFTFIPPAGVKVLTTGQLSLAQAQQQADYHLLIVPDSQKGYILSNVSAINQSGKLLYMFSYRKGTTNFTITESNIPVKQPSGAPVAVRGVPGAITLVNDLRTLTWAEHGIQISVQGMMSKEQVISIAQALS